MFDFSGNIYFSIADAKCKKCGEKTTFNINLLKIHKPHTQWLDSFPAFYTKEWILNRYIVCEKCGTVVIEDMRSETHPNLIKPTGNKEKDILSAMEKLEDWYSLACYYEIRAREESENDEDKFLMYAEKYLNTPTSKYDKEYMIRWDLLRRMGKFEEAKQYYKEHKKSIENYGLAARSIAESIKEHIKICSIVRITHPTQRDQLDI